MDLSVFYHHIEEAAKQRGRSIDDVIGYVHSLGINMAETDLGYLKDSLYAAEMLKKHGMGISSIYAFYDFGNDPDGSIGFKQVDTAVAVECKKIMIIPGFYTSDNNSEREKQRENMLAAMGEMCAYAESKGIVPTIEDFDDCRSPIATAEQMLWFAERIPQLKITFDTGNFMYSGRSELEAFELLKDRIVHVHCKDRSTEEKVSCEMKMTVDGIKMYPTAVGDGCIKMHEIVSALEKRGYDGIYTIEHFGAEDQLEYIKRSVGFFNNEEK